MADGRLVHTRFPLDTPQLMTSEKPAAASPGGSKSGKKSASKDVNKSAEIRRVAAAMKARGEKPRPKLIVEMLRKQGVDVVSPQVSMVLKRMGFRPLRRRKAGKRTAAGVGTGGKAGIAGANVSIDDLIAARKVAKSFGNADRAIAALAALKRFEG